MPSGLHRSYGAHHLHFITSSCYRRLPFLGTVRSRDGAVAVEQLSFPIFWTKPDECA
jgi:hypothetical protein